MAQKMFAIFIALMLFGTAAFADGMVVRPCTAEYWCPHRETQQRAIINYENGNENLLLFIKTDGRPTDAKFLWLFPVPAKPEQIEIANLKGIPSITGTPLKQQMKDNISMLAAANFIAVFPPAAIFLFLMASTISYSGGTMAVAEGMPNKQADRGYEIWQHIDKYGISTEVMTAWDSAKFYHYLEVRGTNISPEAKQRIDEYIGKDYSFIVSWISNPAEYQQQGTGEYVDYYYNSEPIGVFVKFPTEKMYFPMKLTSVYENSYVPAVIDVVGYREPELFANISKETTKEYYFSDRLQYGLDEEESAMKLFNGKIPEQFRFTRISINAQAKYYTQDLWIPNTVNASATGLEIVNAAWLLIAIIIFYLLSCIAIWITNKVALAGFLDNKKMALLALSNFLSIFGFIAAVFALKSQLNEKEKPKFSRWKTIVCYWVLFFGVAIIFGIFAILVNAAIK